MEQNIILEIILSELEKNKGFSLLIIKYDIKPKIKDGILPVR
jgi:hypothetical protein